MNPEQYLRFFQAIKKSDTGCWVWTATAFDNGYPAFKLGNKMLRAHRLAYEIFKGPLDDKEVCHQCDVPLCVNPAHLFKGDRQSNATDMVNKGRQAKKETHGRAVLDAETVKKIRAMYGSDTTPARSRRGALSQVKIAALFGVSRGAVQGIVTNRRWT